MFIVQAAATACLYKQLQNNIFKSVHDLASQMGEMMLGQCPRKRERSHIYFLEQNHKRSRAAKLTRQGPLPFRALVCLASQRGVTSSFSWLVLIRKWKQYVC